MRLPKFARCALWLALLPAAAHAARPMVTDDARIVDPKACQVESWLKFNADSTEAWALPACNPTGNLELTFGGARTHDDDTGTRFSDEVLQAKTLFRPLKDDWGVGLAVGIVRHPHRERAPGWPGDPYFYFPLSVKVLGETWVAHLNAGLTRRRDERRNIGTWGFGNEVRLNPRVYAIAETFGSDRGRPFYQGGVRYWIVKDHVQMDATYGNRLVSDGRERWVSVGLRLIAPAFLP